MADHPIPRAAYLPAIDATILASELNELLASAESSRERKRLRLFARNVGWRALRELMGDDA